MIPGLKGLGARAWLLPAILLIILCAAPTTRAALSLDPPENFFTNVADRLLQQQLGVRLTEIQIRPTNQYSAAVHRILQVTANLYDSTSTNEFPSVFRPLLATNGAGVFLAGFTNDNSAATLNAWMISNPYGVPMAIAARKGFPNFNEFTLRTEIVTQRRLQVTRPSPSAFPNGTNVMYTLSVSNVLGAEGWNPYPNSYPRAAQLTVSNAVTVVFTNEVSIQAGALFRAVSSIDFSPSSWPPYMPAGPNTGIMLPLPINLVSLNNAAYRFFFNTFGNPTNGYENIPGFLIPTSVVTVTNRMVYVLTDSGRIIDFVLLDTVSSVDLNKELWATNPYQSLGASFDIQNLWNTNRTAAAAPTAGILKQMDIALGNTPTTLSEWREFGLSNVSSDERNGQIDAFRAFFGLVPIYTNTPPTNNALVMEAPFNPAAKLQALGTWQVNDPFVRFHNADLTGAMNTNRFYLRPSQPVTNAPPSSLGYLNPRLAPWGGNPQTAEFDPYAFDRSVRDPRVYSPADWNFPTNAPLAASTLGRIHRGTPWQTIYLKADVAPLNAWLEINGDARTHPTNDWRLAALLASWLNTNDVRTLRSVNTTNLDAWAATLTGLTVLSNSASEAELDPFAPPPFQTNLIASNAPQIATVVAGINRTRTAQRGQYFPGVADFLSVPELSSASPWLNLTGELPKYGLIDEAYEILPAQLLSRVRADPVASVTRIGNSNVVTFTVFDGYSYRVEGSSNLTAWATVSQPHVPTNGTFSITVPAATGLQFFRAALLP